MPAEKTRERNNMAHLAEVIAAAAASADSGVWHEVPAVLGATFGGEPEMST
jgi:hypothetical protein